MSEPSFIDRVADRVDVDPDQPPPWTIRCTWRVTDCRDEPFRTYHAADSERSAVARAVFVLDHYRHEAADELVCVDILHPCGRWADVPRSAAAPPPAEPSRVSLGGHPL